MMNRLELARKFSESLNYPEIEKIILFGSVARGDDREGSDIDIIIISTKKTEIKDKVIRKARDILLSTGVHISVKVISPEEYRFLGDTHFISRIRKEGVVLG